MSGLIPPPGRQESQGGAPWHGGPQSGYGGPQTPPPFGQVSSGPPARKSKTGLVLGLAGGVVAMVLCVVVGIVALGGTGSGGGLGGGLGGGVLGGGQLVISNPPTAGGFSRTSVDAKVPQQYLSTYRDAFAPLGGKIDNLVFAGYDDTADHGTIALVGINGSGFDPSSLQAKVASLSTSSGAWSTTDPGANGGQAVCSPGRPEDNSGSSCAWMTSTSIGMISVNPKDETGGLPVVPESRLADIMRKIRPDVEHAR